MGKGFGCARASLSVTLFAWGAAGALPSAAVAGPYQYTLVVDSAGPFGTSGMSDHALGNNGHVVFANLRDDGQNSINRWNGSGLQTVAVTGPTAPGWTTALHGVGVNGSGQASFIGWRTASQSEGYFGAYRGEVGSAVTTISEVPLNQTGPVYEYGSDINASGTVAYHRVDSTSRGIYTRNGVGAEQTVFVAPSSDTLGFWSINSSGHVAITGVIGGVRGVWKGTGNGTLTPVATGNFNSVRTPVIDDAGNVTFSATLTNGTQGVYRGNGSGGLTTIADTSGGAIVNNANAFARTSSNNDGDVAFMGTPTGGTPGIHFLPAGGNLADAQTVISIGDELFGGVVESVFLNPRGLNDADQIAFTYKLVPEAGQTVGTWGIAVAAIPEPSGLALLGLGGAALLRRRRRVVWQ